ncbi:hypothetical protein HBA_0316 [Sodalis endosymbiont of Henestaris halophilus]|nr:hypothetical protein HBA_0316 [Sodalis endosymbiont of Henestaris halophilus]
MHLFAGSSFISLTNNRVNTPVVLVLYTTAYGLTFLDASNAYDLNLASQVLVPRVLMQVYIVKK